MWQRHWLSLAHVLAHSWTLTVWLTCHRINALRSLQDNLSSLWSKQSQGPQTPKILLSPCPATMVSPAVIHMVLPSVFMCNRPWMDMHQTLLMML